MSSALETPIHRTIQYLGNKSRFLGHISRAIDEVSRDPCAAVVDPFAGTGSVARFMAAFRPVLASDIQEYSRVLVAAAGAPASHRAMLRPIVSRAIARFRGLADQPEVRPLLDAERQAYLEPRIASVAEYLEAGSMVGEGVGWLGGDLAETRNWALAQGDAATLLTYYGGVYFSYRQALLIDSIRVEASRADEGLRDLVLAVALGTASEVSTSIGGHFAQPIRPRDRNGAVKLAVVERIARRRSESVMGVVDDWVASIERQTEPAFTLSSSRSDFATAIKLAGSSAPCVVYADPPYTREHYSRFYHVLETIALGDNPGLSRSNLNGGSQPSRGLYRLERHQSPFSIPTRAPAAFEELFRAAAELDAPLVLSYSPTYERSDGQVRSVEITDLIDIAARHYRSVRVEPIGGARHARLNSKHTHAARGEAAEVLLLATL